MYPVSVFKRPTQISGIYFISLVSFWCKHPFFVLQSKHHEVPQQETIFAVAYQSESIFNRADGSSVALAN